MKLKILLWLIAALLTLAAVGSQIEANDVVVQGTDPRLDPQFSEVSTLSLSSRYEYIGDPDLLKAFDTARAEYDIAEAAAAGRRVTWEERRTMSIVLLVLVLTLLGLLALPWGDWFRSAANDLSEVEEGLASLYTSAKTRVRGQPGMGIIGHEKMTRYSVADEMLKWKQLLDDGVVTQSEFDEARIKLLKR